MLGHGGLPGEDLFITGVADLRAGVASPEALLIASARARLTAAGLEVPASDVERPAHALYDALAAEDPDDAHGRYNALMRRLASFAHAVEHASTH